MKEKSVTFTKGKSKFLQNQRVDRDFSVGNLGLFFQSSGNIKQEIITRNWTHKLPHKLPNNLGLIVVGNEDLIIKALMNWWFNDSWARGFERVTRGFEFQLVFLNFNSCIWISSRAFKLSPRNSQLLFYHITHMTSL